MTYETKRTFRSFIKNVKEHKNVPFFYKDWKRTQRSERSFIKKGKERKDCSVSLLRTEKNAKIIPFFYKARKRTQRSFRSFEKNRCPTLCLPITSYHPANFFSWILMKIGESVRLGLLRKVMKGNFERKIFLPKIFKV